MNEYLNKTFEIKDEKSRSWGTFTVRQVFDSNINGRLHPSPDYDQVKQVFLDHEKVIESGIGDSEKTTSAILKLGAYLTDGVKNYPISNILFISEKLLVTCKID